MQCTRAAFVEYVVTATPLEVAPGDAPGKATITISVEARVVRRLLTVDPDARGWPDTVAAPLFEAATIPVMTTTRTLKGDASAWQGWQAQIQDREEMLRQWRSVPTHLENVVPRKTLVELVEGYLSEDDRQVMRFGQQMDALFAPPTDAKGLARCQDLAKQLAHWVDAATMEETAEALYRLCTRVEEDAAVMTTELRERHGAVFGEVEAQFRDEAAKGYCLPEKQCAFLDEMVFVFDGQYAPEEMRMLMTEYLNDLRARIEQASIALDGTRDQAEAERAGEIPDRVRALVWRRDQARCVVCGAASDLEFDHVIPRSLGGASTVRNVQVLCIRCNEKKGAQVARIAAARLERVKESDTLSLFDEAPDS